MPATKTRPAASRPRSAAPGLPMPPVLLEATETPDIVTVPPRSVILIEGQGAPEGEAFQQSVAALYGVAYAVKFARKKTGESDFKVGPLEARWWSDRAAPIVQVSRDRWRWSLRLAVPDDVTDEQLARLIDIVTSRKGGKLEASAEAWRVTVERLPEGRYARILHVGPYADEGRSFSRIQEMLDKAGIQPGHAHLEVYLGDPRRVKPDKLRTVLLLEVA